MSNSNIQKNSGRFNTGLILIAIGALLLLKTMNLVFLPWLFSWPMIFVAIGIISMARHGFNSGFGIFMILFGGFFLLRNEGWLPLEYRQYLVPGGLIALGIFLIITQGFTKRRFCKHGNFDNFGSSNYTEDSSEFIDTEATFCGINKKVLSKNLKGGHIEVNFGGTDLDLTQADIDEVATIKVDVNFGGLKLIVPPHWDVQTSVSSVFAGVEDKRKFGTNQVTSKTLKITGSVTFGGIEIKSY